VRIKIPFEYIDPKAYYSNFHKNDTLYDYTKIFVKAIKTLSKRPGFGGIAWITGTAGSGKSVLMCIIDNLLLQGSPEKRNIAFYQAPDSLLKAVKNAVPRFMREKFRIIDRLSEIETFDVMNLDEGYLAADAKDYLKKNERNFIKSLTTLRHKSVITILNSLDDGILRGYRTKAQLRFYKQLTDGYIEENPKDRFAKLHAEAITSLEPHETIYRITQPHLLKFGLRKGALVMPLKKYCPWYNDQISRSFEGENFDALLRETERIKERAEPLIKLLSSVFGPKITVSDAIGYLWDNHPSLLLEFEDQLKYIVSAIKTRYKLAKLNKKKYQRIEKLRDDFDKKEEIYQKIQLPEINKETKFPEFLLQFYRLNLKTYEDAEKEYHALIMHDWANGLSQADIREQRGGAPNTINAIIKKYRSGANLLNDQLRVSYALEHYIARLTDGVRLGGKGEPDILYYENMKELGPGEVKLVQTRSNRIRFYLYSKNPNHHSLNASFKYCLEKGLERFPLFYYWPKWGIIPMLIYVQMPDQGTPALEYSIWVEKEKYEEYVMNFKLFNKFTFFYRSRQK